MLLYLFYYYVYQNWSAKILIFSRKRKTFGIFFRKINIFMLFFFI